MLIYEFANGKMFLPQQMHGRIVIRPSG